MKLWKKIAIGTGITGAVAGGIWFLPKLIRLKRASAKLDIVPTAMLHDVRGGITVRIDVSLKNPTNNAFKMRFPYVKVTYKNNLLATSESVNKIILMKSFGEAKIQRIMLFIPVGKLLITAAGLLSAMGKGEEAKVDITTQTHVDPYWRYIEAEDKWERVKLAGDSTWIPYSDTQSIPILKQAQ